MMGRDKEGVDAAMAGFISMLEDEKDSVPALLGMSLAFTLEDSPNKVRLQDSTAIVPSPVTKSGVCPMNICRGMIQRRYIGHFLQLLLGQTIPSACSSSKFASFSERTGIYNILCCVKCVYKSNSVASCAGLLSISLLFRLVSTSPKIKQIPLREFALRLLLSSQARNALKRIAKMPYTLKSAEEFEQAYLHLAHLYVDRGKYDLAQVNEALASGLTPRLEVQRTFRIDAVHRFKQYLESTFYKTLTDSVRLHLFAERA